MKINYPSPHNILNNNSSSINQKQQSRGMLFEHELNKSNEYYINTNKALIYKKPTPIKIVKVDYPNRSHAKIVEGYYQTPSTTDYNGIYRGKYVDYEAKETQNLSFSFTHIFPHQVEHLKKVDEHGGIAFVIIFFKKVDKVYLIDIKDFYKAYKAGQSGERNSIKESDIINIGGLEVSRGYSPYIDYLKQVDIKYFDNKTATE